MKKLLLIIAVTLAAKFGVQAEDSGTNTPPPIPDKLKVCVVSGEKLGEMGEPLVFTYKGQEVKLCCKSCKKKFDKEPEKYITKIRAADKPAKN